MLESSRRQFLQSAACGFGWLAWSALGGQRVVAAPIEHPLPQFAPRAKRVIFLFMPGGPSHVDTFDHKPLLEREDGKEMPFEDPRLISKNAGERISSRRVMKSLWKFAKHGDCGHWVSELFPHQATCVDDLCFLHGVHTEGLAHGPATLFMHCGESTLIRPSIGSWISYGLGTENDNLPAFVSIAPVSVHGGPRNYGAGFLPAMYQGTPLQSSGATAGQVTVRNLRNPHLTSAEQRQQLDLIRELNDVKLRSTRGDSEFEAAVESFDLAWRMQSYVPELLDLSRESAATLATYGIGDKSTDKFGRQCLLARRMAEAGVRYIQVTHGGGTTWDHHSKIASHADAAVAVDKPIAGLIDDLKQRGLLDDTLVWWGGEFGRTPYAQGKEGRDHNPDGFTMWLAGAGVKPGFSLGGTDDFGRAAIDGRVHMHDVHATILHLLGIDHERLTYRYAGRDFRLTDVAGRVVNEILS